MGMNGKMIKVFRFCCGVMDFELLVTSISMYITGSRTGVLLPPLLSLFLKTILAYKNAGIVSG